MLENKKSVIQKQLVLLLEELESDPTMSREPVISSKAQDDRWHKLVEKLNAVPNGAKRSVPRWKAVLKDWKLNVKEQVNTDEYLDNPDMLNDLGKRLLRLIEDEDLHRDMDIDMIADTVIPGGADENINISRRSKRSNRRRARRAIAAEHEADITQDLRLIYDTTNDAAGNPQKKIMQKQLDRLHYVSRELEGHIKQVQDRIQLIKDMWQHDCGDNY